MSSKPKTKVTINNGNNSNAGGRVNNNLKVQNIQTVKDDCLTSQSLDNFLSFIRNIESLYRMAVAEEQETMIQRKILCTAWNLRSIHITNLHSYLKNLQRFANSAEWLKILLRS